MAKCEEGYLCEVCGGDVERLRDSGLYLQFILGWIDPETLHTRREVHIECLPALAQFIDDPNFRALRSATSRVISDVAPEFARENLNADFAAARARQVTVAYQRLLELDNAAERPPVTEYPLPSAIERWR